jgi:hypothetical protein
LHPILRQADDQRAETDERRRDDQHDQQQRQDVRS